MCFWLRNSGFEPIHQLEFILNELAFKNYVQVQLQLYTFIANDQLLSVVRRTHTVVTLVHTLKTYYWVVLPSQLPANVCQTRSEQFDQSIVVQIRAAILRSIDRLMFTIPSDDTDEKQINRDDEFQCLFNFISTVKEDDNLYDVLTQLANHMANHPAIMVQFYNGK